MSTSAIPPPIPPIRKIFENSSSSSIESRKTTPPSVTTPVKKSIIFECLWASQYPDIQQSCYLSQTCTLWPPKACRFLEIPSIIQSGPTCGLAAISMVLNGNPNPETILTKAKCRMFTINGEMFSARNLYELLCDILKEKNYKEDRTIQCQLYQGELNCAKVKELLIDGGCLLVPYPFFKKKNTKLKLETLT